MSDSPWRDRLRPASFRGAGFNVEVSARAGGRRVALHEFPKRDEPYAEDMGRRARRHQVTAYLIGPDYLDDRDVLLEALEREGAGLLVHPTLGEFDVLCEGFGANERRERGGFVEVEMTFVEAGSKPGATQSEDTSGKVTEKADTAAETSSKALDQSTPDFSSANSSGAY